MICRNDVVCYRGPIIIKGKERLTVEYVGVLDICLLRSEKLDYRSL